MIATTKQLQRLSDRITNTCDYANQRVHAEAQARVTVDDGLQLQLDRATLHIGILMRHLGLAFDDGIRVVRTKDIK